MPEIVAPADPADVLLAESEREGALTRPLHTYVQDDGPSCSGPAAQTEPNNQEQQ